MKMLPLLVEMGSEVKEGMIDRKRQRRREGRGASYPQKENCCEWRRSEEGSHVYKQHTYRRRTAEGEVYVEKTESSSRVEGD